MQGDSVVAGALLALLVIGSNALYEDQIKKFDWRTLHIGALGQGHLTLNTFEPRLLVSTQSNVIAALCPKSGELLWRQVLERSPRGDIKLLQVTSAGGGDSSTAAARPNSNHGFDMLTVQGHSPALVRGWNGNTGAIEWEWSLMPLQLEHAASAFWFYSNAMIYHVIPVWHSHLEVTQYFVTTGQSMGSTARIAALWISEENCVRSGVYYICLEGTQLIGLDLTTAQPTVLRKSLEKASSGGIKALKGANGAVIVDKMLASLNDQFKACEHLRSNSFILGSNNQRQVIIQADLDDKNTLQIRAYNVENCSPIDELSVSLAYPNHHGTPSLVSFDCKAKRSNCLFILETTDEAILAVQKDKLRWVREEALANVVGTEFVDLPLADTEGTLESEMRGKSGDIGSAFVRRITTQMLQIKSIFLHVIGLGPPPTDTQRAGLVRDPFGLHKMLVVLTRCGKLFGLDNITGKQHWQHFIVASTSFSNDEPMRLLVQRTSKHFPLHPLCTIVARHAETGNGMLFQFNPITGEATEGGLLQLSYKVKQLALLAESEGDSVKGILLMDAANNVHVHPQSATKMANGMYVFTADKALAALDGFLVQLTASKRLISSPMWSVRLGGHMGEHQIVAVAAKTSIERVHSLGRVLGDRSVLYKYINPNLVAVVTQANDNIHKYILNVHLIDVVSGSVVYSLTHRKARGPVHIVHSENWLAYSYYNDKVRRTEITTVELYEAKTQVNSTVWSSLNAPPMPLVERQSYILPTLVETMRETITERGITNKHVLIGTASGAIIEMPWALLDPRRPTTSTSVGREEGAIPYIPELPLPTENIINYNQTIACLRSIYTAPSGLESTCLVFATGLDMFATRIAPSKTFDMLKEDFDYILITIVLVALTSGSLVARHLASRKILKQAWK